MAFDPEQLRARLRAAGPPPSFAHVFDPDLPQRLQDHWAAHWGTEAFGYGNTSDARCEDDVEPVEPEPTRRRRRRRPSLDSAIRSAEAAGKIVTSATVTRDGIVLTFSDGVMATKTDASEWDGVLQ